MLSLDDNRLCAIMASLARRANHSEKMMSWIRRQTEMSVWLIQLFFIERKRTVFFRYGPYLGFFAEVYSG